MRTPTQKLGDDSAWISEGQLRARARAPERADRKPRPLDLARRVFLIAALGICVFVAVSIALTGV